MSILGHSGLTVHLQQGQTTPMRYSNRCIGYSDPMADRLNLFEYFAVAIPDHAMTSFTDITEVDELCGNLVFDAMKFGAD